MLHACVERFDVIGRRENILGWDREVNKAWIKESETFVRIAEVLNSKASLNDQFHYTVSNMATSSRVGWNDEWNNLHGAAFHFTNSKAK
jgi:hypothetical protein